MSWNTSYELVERAWYILRGTIILYSHVFRRLPQQKTAPKRTSMETEQVGVQFSQYKNTDGSIRDTVWEKYLGLRLLLLVLLLRACLCSVLYGSRARRHRGALYSACVGRAVRCTCGAVTRPRAQSTTINTFFADRSSLQQN